jgi:acylphosphatase
MPRLHVRISGRVQGVGFRIAVYREAQSLSITGWVRNLPDRSVEAEFEGDRPALEMMHRWCDQGPTFARVDAVSSEWLGGEAGYTEFEIR